MSRRFTASPSFRSFYIIVILFRVATVMSKRLNLYNTLQDCKTHLTGLNWQNQEMTSNTTSHVGWQICLKHLNSLSVLIGRIK
jgi:hypothetical protein